MRMEKSSDCYRHTRTASKTEEGPEGRLVNDERKTCDSRYRAGKRYVVSFHFHPMHGNMVRAVGFHTVLPRSSNETCPAFVWRTNRALPVSLLRYGGDRG